MDIREIRLSKKFNGHQDSMGTLGTSFSQRSSSWHVFGHYDYMDISKISIDEDNPMQDAAEEIHPLERILKCSDEWTLNNKGDTKQHLLYCIANNDKDANLFWNSSAKQPLLLVSLVHFVHPLSNSFAGMVEYLEEAIQRICGEYQNIFNRSFRLLHSFYISLDANDLIIFWSANSLQATMSVIARVWEQCADKVCEIFTIMGCHKGILNAPSDYQDLYNKWKSVEGDFSCVRTHVRGKNYRQILEKANGIVEELKRLQQINYKRLNAQKYIIPGQDDIVLSFENLPFDLFIEMYMSRNGIQPTNPLTGVFGNDTDVVSRSIVDTVTHFSMTGINHHGTDNNSNKTSTEIFQLYQELKATIDNCPDFPRVQWLSALYELLIELAYLETSPTAHDMYMQSKDCQTVLVKHIIEIITKGNETDASPEKKKCYCALTDPHSHLVERIQRYIQGWSQLSFHAMLAELQLTHTSDINRMYLYPAKLNRIYASFMQRSSDILNEEDSDNAKSKKEAFFFLTPSMRSNENFLSIFDEYRDTFDTNSELLVLGEIPAELLFSPQVLLPILVHEAAHYAGHEKRKRPLRYKCIAKSMLAHLVDEYVLDPILYQVASDGRFPFQDVVDKIYKDDFECLMDGDICYGNTVQDVLLNALQGELQSSYFPNRVFSILLSRDEYANWSQTRKLIFKEENLGNMDSDIRSLNTLRTANNIEEHLYRLMSIYREAYADMCMIRLLDLSPLEYLGIIYRSNHFDKGEDKAKLIEISLRHKLFEYERYLSVISIAFADNGSDELDMNIVESILENCKLESQFQGQLVDSINFINHKDLEGIKVLAENLLRLYQNEGLYYKEPEPESTTKYSRHVYFFERIWLFHYLRAVKKALPRKVAELRNVYEVLAKNVRNMSGTDDIPLINHLSVCIDIAKDERGDGNISPYLDEHKA